MKIYFNEEKQAFDFKIANSIAEIESDIWVKHCKKPAGTSWDIVDGEFVDLRETPEYLAAELETKKQEKLAENEKMRDTHLLSGVTYKDVVFDSDTDQKINLMFTANSMSESDSIFWLGKDNVPLECTKQDLINIGLLIAELTSYVWSVKSPSYVQQINSAPDVETLNSIIIEY